MVKDLIRSLLSTLKDNAIERDLSALENYKYSGIDYSIISRYVLYYYWTFMAELFPSWMAPNLITVIGFCFIIFNYILMIIYIPDFVGPAPSWVYFSFALGVWIYSTFDNVDGKQARKTNSSSPLGELFDHSCDAFSIGLISLLQVSGMGVGMTYKALAVPVVFISSFYLATWESYHTGSLTLGYVNGPTEGILASCLMFITSGIYGPTFWTLPISRFQVSYLPAGIQNSSIFDITFWSFIVMFFVYQAPSCFLSLSRYYKKNKLKAYGSSLYLFSTLVPLIVYISCYVLWATGRYSNMWSSHAALFNAILSIVFSRITTKIILAHLLKGKFPFFTILIVPLVIGAALSWTWASFPCYESRFLYLYFVFAMIVYFHWAKTITNRLCKFLNINCFSLKKRKPVHSE